MGRLASRCLLGLILTVISCSGSSPARPGSGGARAGGTAGAIDVGPGGPGLGGGGAAGQGPGGIGGATAGTNGGVAGSTAGTSGGVGGLASGGHGGTGAGGGAVLPSCSTTTFPPAGSPTTLRAGGVLLDSTGAQATSPAATEAVTVSSVDSCATVTCQCASPDCFRINAMTDATRIVLGGPGAGQQRTLLAVIPGLPLDLVNAGDTLELSVDSFDTLASWGYQITLSQGGKLLLFTSDQSRLLGPGPPSLPLPELFAFGVDFSVLGPECDLGGICPQSRQAVQVSRGNEVGMVRVGEIVKVGDLNVSAAQLTGESSNGGCDFPAQADIAGFVSR